MGRIIEAKTFQARKTVIFARWLLGKFLVRRLPNGSEEARMILETEAYCGESDLACHARAGRTKRTEVMYGEGGVWYVYLCYGIHEMLNLVVGPRDWPEAILIRGVDGAIGPGRVTKTLAIDRRLNATPAEPATGLWLEDRGVRVPRAAVEVTPRIGVDYAGPLWSPKHWRFTLDPRSLPSRRAALRKPESIQFASRPSTRARAMPAGPTSQDR
ncbi:MAG: DNA-3-methyladenine glycosylase [Opitutaceae bacterium]